MEKNRCSSNVYSPKVEFAEIKFKRVEYITAFQYIIRPAKLARIISEKYAFK
jgi:hypothetical protein